MQPLNDHRASRWACSLPRPALDHIQAGTLNYRYKGIPTLKNPFDLALYPLLLWQLQPKTLIEIGSRFGGSAVWFADQIRSLELSCSVHSFDIKPVTEITYPNVTFYQADAQHLSASISADFLQSLPHPWLVIEDSAHTFEVTRAVMDFFHPSLAPGDYLVIEDGIVSDLGIADQFQEGPDLGTFAPSCESMTCQK